jgi:hypothetical protein
MDRTRRPRVRWPEMRQISLILLSLGAMLIVPGWRASAASWWMPPALEADPQPIPPAPIPRPPGVPIPPTPNPPPQPEPIPPAPIR